MDKEQVFFAPRRLRPVFIAMGLAFPFFLLGVLIIGEIIPLSVLPFPLPPMGTMDPKTVIGLVFLLIGGSLETIGALKVVAEAARYQIRGNEIILFRGFSKTVVSVVDLEAFRALTALEADEAILNLRRQGCVAAGPGGFLAYCTSASEMGTGSIPPGFPPPVDQPTRFILLEMKDSRRFLLDPIDVPGLLSILRERFDGLRG
jgi:hypothetical protein